MTIRTPSDPDGGIRSMCANPGEGRLRRRLLPQSLNHQVIADHAQANDLDPVLYPLVSSSDLEGRITARDAICPLLPAHPKDRPPVGDSGPRNNAGKTVRLPSTRMARVG